MFSALTLGAEARITLELAFMALNFALVIGLASLIDKAEGSDRSWPRRLLVQRNK